jgi:DNA-nicking Smr family endonuclease
LNSQETATGFSGQSSSNDPEELREQANHLYAQAKSLSDQSQEAYRAGDGARAKQLSNQKRKVYAQAEAINARAQQTAFSQVNQGKGLEEIDLHGLYVKEAVDAVNCRVRECRKHGISTLVCITGRGNGSVDNVARIKPRIVELAASQGLTFQENHPNDGCVTIYVDLNSRGKKLLPKECRFL